MATKKPSGAVMEEELERLYLQPPERFTKTRDDLSRSLRERGERDAAAEVKRLRRPSQAAWLINQLALRHGDAVEELLAIGTRLRKLEDEMLAGKDATGALRTAATDERAAIAGLVDSAKAIASDGGQKLSPPTLDRVAETLQAASTDTALAERVRSGRLEKEARAATLGVGSGVPARARGRKTAVRKDERRAEREQARLEVEASRRDVERAEARRDRAQDEVDQQAARLREARKALADAKRDAKRLATELERAEGRAKKLG